MKIENFVSKCNFVSIEYGFESVSDIVNSLKTFEFELNSIE